MEEAAGGRKDDICDHGLSRRSLKVKPRTRYPAWYPSLVWVKHYLGRDWFVPETGLES